MARTQAHATRSSSPNQIDELDDTRLQKVTGGSPSSGGGAGFHEFAITKYVDKASPILFLSP